jgi:hypothetical protein
MDKSTLCPNQGFLQENIFSPQTFWRSFEPFKKPLSKSLGRKILNQTNLKNELQRAMPDRSAPKH